MAKKNIVHITGYVNEILINEGNNFLFSVQVRKNPNKFVYPIIELGEENLHMKEQIVQGKIVLIEGKVTTTPKEMELMCECGRVVKNRYIFTSVTSKKVLVFEPMVEEPFINKVILLGTVCNEKEFKYIKGTRSLVENTKYQMAVNRREPNSTDYPWITTFARQAVEDAKRINVGSQILVEGTINTRLHTKNCTCECGNEIQVREPHTEILGVSVEYLNNCYFEKDEK